MIVTGSGTATSGSSVLCTVPPGPCTVLLAVSGTATPVWVGAGGSVSAGNGLPVPAGVVPVTFPGYLGDGGSKLAVCTSGGSSVIGFLISTATAGTGP